MHTPRLLLFVWLVSLPAGAETIYKVTDAQGNITYTAEAPNPAAGLRVEPVNPTAPPSGAAVNATQARERQLQDAARGADPAVAQRRAQRKERETKLRAAQTALDTARLAYTEGQAPEPGERSGNASKGRSRLNEAYAARISKLEEAVKAAETALATAQQQLRDSP